MNGWAILENGLREASPNSAAGTNLFHSDLQPVQTNTLTTGAAYFSGPLWTDYPGRFYRLRSPRWVSSNFNQRLRGFGT